MRGNWTSNIALLFAFSLTGCGNQSDDIQQGPWYEIGKAEPPDEQWPREVLKQGTWPNSIEEQETHWPQYNQWKWHEY
jgi:predicted small lipoprotein YifL